MYLQGCWEVTHTYYTQNVAILFVLYIYMSYRYLYLHTHTRKHTLIHIQHHLCIQQGDHDDMMTVTMIMKE